MTNQPAKRDDLMDLAEAVGVTTRSYLLGDLEADCADIAALFNRLADNDHRAGTR